jgi:transposase
MSQDDLNALSDDINQLKKLVLSSRMDVENQQRMLTDNQNEIQRLNEIIKLFQGNIFGKSSEKSPDQAELFNEAEVESLSPDDLTAYVVEDVEADPIESTINSKEKSG